MRCGHPNPQQGFTIIEVLLVIVIMGIFLALAAPSFVTFTSGQKVKTTSFDVYAALVFARSEAIKRRKCISVTPCTDPTCVSGAGTDWTVGWRVSEVADPACTPNSADPALRTQNAPSGVLMSGDTSVVYRLDGRLTSTGARGVLIQPQIADASIKNRCIRVDLTGLPKSTNIDTTTCP